MSGVLSAGRASWWLLVQGHMDWEGRQIRAGQAPPVCISARWIPTYIASLFLTSSPGVLPLIQDAYLHDCNHLLLEHFASALVRMLIRTLQCCQTMSSVCIPVVHCSEHDSLHLYRHSQEARVFAYPPSACKCSSERGWMWGCGCLACGACGTCCLMPGRGTSKQPPSCSQVHASLHPAVISKCQTLSALCLALLLHFDNLLGCSHMGSLDPAYPGVKYIMQAFGMMMSQQTCSSWGYWPCNCQW